MLAQLVAQSSTTSGRHSATFYVVAILVQAAVALIPAFIASSKGHSFVGFWFFGLLCWIPALIVSIVMRSKLPPQPTFYRDGGYSYQQPARSWGTNPAPPPVSGPPPGWYADPGGSPQQRYWDGARWTEHLH